MSRSHSGNFRGHPPLRGITRPEGFHQQIHLQQDQNNRPTDIIMIT